MSEAPSVWLILWLTLIGRRGDVLEMAEWAAQSNGTISTPVLWAIKYGYHFWFFVFAIVLFVLFKLLSRKGEASPD